MRSYAVVLYQPGQLGLSVFSVNSTQSPFSPLTRILYIGIQSLPSWETSSGGLICEPIFQSANQGSAIIQIFDLYSRTCVGTSVVPRGPGFPTLVGPNQGCTMRGSIPGQPNVSGEAYIQASYTYSRQYIWRNFGFEVSFL